MCGVCVHVSFVENVCVCVCVCVSIVENMCVDCRSFKKRVKETEVKNSDSSER